MLKLVNIQAKKGCFRLKNLNLSLVPGAFNVLLGPTGSGKTLVLELISGLFKAESGSVLIDNHAVHLLAPCKRNIAYLPQDNTLFPHKNVFENIAYGLQLQNKESKALVKEKVENIAKLLNIDALLHRKTEGLSGGEAQRVALARALVLDRKILLMDEPTSALHQRMQQDFCLLLKALQQKLKLTVLMTTHHKDSAFMVGDVMHFMDNGSVIMSASSRDIYSMPLPRKVAYVLGIKNIIPFRQIQQGDQVCEYFSEELNCQLSLSHAFSQQQASLFIGLRSQDVRIVKKENEEKVHQNYFYLTVQDIIYLENDAIVKGWSPQSGFIMEIQLCIYHLKHMQIETGKTIKCKIYERYARVIGS